uniref:efflux RND transporter permease subunit n=1 Tax=Paraburkholderia sp. TaxID=1926495 RepID=UPI0025D7DE74
MNISRLFILRPVATSLLMIAMVLIGLVAMKFLPVSSLPSVDYPTIQVQTFYPGASPSVMATTVTAPLEVQLGEIPGLQQMVSYSSEGASIITLQFDLALNLDVAEQNVQQAINSANSFLPSGLPAPPTYAKVNPADQPILTLAVTSKSMSLTQLQDAANNRLATKISEVPGVGLVTTAGGNVPAVRVEADPQKLAAYGLNLDDLRTLLANVNVSNPKGNFDGPELNYTINSNDQISAPQDYENTVIAYQNGSPVFMRDVARVTSAAQDIERGAWYNHAPAIVLNVQRQPGANVIATVNQIMKQLPQLESTLPAGMQVTVVSNSVGVIRASVADAAFELVLAVVLVVAVIFVFLRNVPATIIPSISVPVSLIGTLALMYELNYSIDNLSLMALIIATGFVVDDSIVMIENIVRYLEEGKRPLQAALEGAGQIGFTILSLTISLIAVLIPLLFMGEIVGRLFREFAITLAVTILVSAVVSLTLTPMMCAKLLRHQKKEEATWFYRKSEDVFNAVIRFYGRTLQFVLRFRTITLLVTAATLVGTILLYIYVPKGFFPVQDTGVILGVSEAPQSISFQAMGERQRALADAILEDPAVESLSSFIGIDGTDTTLNSGRIQINLKPLKERKLSASDVIRRLQPRLDKIDGITLFMQPVQDLTVEDRVSRTQFQYSLEDVDPKELAVWVPRFMERLKKLPELRDVASDQLNGGLLVHLTIDRDSASRLGVLPADVDNTLYDAFGQRQVSTIYTQLNQYHVVLEADPKFQQTPDALKDIYVRSSNGTQVPLSTFTTVSTAPSALALNHQGQFPVVTVSFNLAPNASLGDAVDAINRVKGELGMPPSVRATFQGTAAAFLKSIANEPILILAALIT